MNFEPQKFFIGLIDFFSTLLPGAVLAYLTKNWAGPLLLGNAYTDLQGAEAWILFLFASYLLGHFLFLVGSGLDDLAYDPLRKMTDEGEITRLLNVGQPSPRFFHKIFAFATSYSGRMAIDAGVAVVANL